MNYTIFSDISFAVGLIGFISGLIIKIADKTKRKPALYLIIGAVLFFVIGVVLRFFDFINRIC